MAEHECGEPHLDPATLRTRHIHLAEIDLHLLPRRKLLYGCKFARVNYTGKVIFGSQAVYIAAYGALLEVAGVILLEPVADLSRGDAWICPYPVQYYGLEFLKYGQLSYLRSLRLLILDAHVPISPHRIAVNTERLCRAALTVFQRL